jgi:hypothetical protein
VCLAVWRDRYKFRLHVFLLDGHCLYSESSNEPAVCDVVWSPCGSMVAISKWYCKVSYFYWVLVLFSNYIVYFVKYCTPLVYHTPLF